MKNQLLFKITFSKTIVLFFTAMVLISCKKDDDDPVPPVVNEDVSFKVELIKMVALDIKDAEGGALEVYGSVNSELVRDNITEENEVWSVVDIDYISVGLSDYPMTSEVIYEVSPGNISESVMEVTASLDEYDESNADEFLGTQTITTQLNDVSSTSTYQMVLDDSEGQEVQVTYAITRL